MSFVRRKKQGGKTYLYEVESYRDQGTGKVRQKIKQYLGRDPQELADEMSRKLGTTAAKLGTTRITPPAELPTLRIKARSHSGGAQIAKHLELAIIEIGTETFLLQPEQISLEE